MRAPCSIKCDDGGEPRNARLYDRLERALIAMEYALADARSSELGAPSQELHRIARSQEALQSAGEELQEILLALKAAALEHAALRARQWS
jgi:hypothetical protein